MVAGEHSPEELLGVVVHVVVAVPGGADPAAGPVAEQPRGHLALAKATSQKVLVVVPNLFQFLVREFHGRTRPKSFPTRFAFLLELRGGDTCQARALCFREGYVVGSVARGEEREVQSERLIPLASQEHGGRLIKAPIRLLATGLQFFQPFLTLRQALGRPLAFHKAAQRETAVLIAAARVRVFRRGHGGRKALVAGKLRGTFGNSGGYSGVDLGRGELGVAI